MKIEAGKYYVTRGGDVVGPVSYYRPWGWQCPLRGGGTLTVGVRGKFAGDGINHPNDLIKEHVMPKFKIGDRVKWGRMAGSVRNLRQRITVMFDGGSEMNFEPEELEAEIIPQPLPSLDLTKPVQTRDGRKVRVLCTDGPGELPVVGFIEDNVTTTQWPVGGEYYGGALRNFDLVNTPATPRTFERWFNVYDRGVSVGWESQMSADRADKDSLRDRRRDGPRIARKRVVFTEGEWDE